MDQHRYDSALNYARLVLLSAKLDCVEEITQDDDCEH